MMFTSLMILAFVNFAPAHAGRVEDSPGDTEITDISISSMTPSADAVLMHQDQSKPAVGESLSVGRGRGKKPRMVASGNFNMNMGGGAAGGLNRDDFI